MAVQIIEETPVYTGLTYEKYLDLPLITQRYDILDGDLFMSPAPSDDHQFELSDLNDEVKRYVRDNDLGFVLFAPHDVIIRRVPRLRTRQPDLIFYSTQTIGGASKAAFKAARRRDVTPDLAVEIISDSDHRRVLQGKLTDYAEKGIAEVWKIDRDARTVTTLRLEDRRYVETARFGEDEYLVTGLLPGFSLRVSEIFA